MCHNNTSNCYYTHNQLKDNKMKLLIVVLALFSLQTYAVESEQDKLKCVVNISSEQAEEVSLLGLDAIKSGADNKDPKSLNMLGALYLSGTLVDKDEELGFSYVKQAAELGRDSAIRALFSLYFCGLGTEVNQDEGISWLEKHLDNLVENYNINGEDIEYKGSDKYVKTAYQLANEYISSNNPKHKAKLSGVINTLIDQTYIAISSAEQMVNNPESIRVVSGTDLNNEQISNHYNKVVSRFKVRLDTLLKFKANNNEY